ncbi:MAG: hypothetical protein OWU84_04490 [Firmicutes bacterium]|nr:hypothetical protein [Bacillota bacterium]
MNVRDSRRWLVLLPDDGLSSLDAWFAAIPKALRARIRAVTVDLIRGRVVAASAPWPKSWRTPFPGFSTPIATRHNPAPRTGGSSDGHFELAAGHGLRTPDAASTGSVSRY